MHSMEKIDQEATLKANNYDRICQAVYGEEWFVQKLLITSVRLAAADAPIIRGSGVGVGKNCVGEGTGDVDQVAPT